MGNVKLSSQAHPAVGEMALLIIALPLSLLPGKAEVPPPID
jgi:hypothetical protein